MLRYTECVKHLIDVDEDALARVKLALRTTTIKDTVNTALHRVLAERDAQLTDAINEMARLNDEIPPRPREDAW